MAKLILDARLVFDDGDPAAQAAFNHLVSLDAGAFEPATGRRVQSRVQLHRCHHDESNEPCEPLQSWEAQ